MRMMIDSVISYSHVVAGTVKIVAEWHDLPPILERTCELPRRLCARKGVDLVLDIDAGVPRMRVDEMRLSEVLEQLLDNAAKFTESGSVRLEVRRDVEEMVFEVIDTGPGISPEAEMRLYEPYSKTLVQDGQLRRGVGLGLTLARALANLMRGKLDYKTELHKGTTFTLRLPLDHVVPEPLADDWEI